MNMNMRVPSVSMSMATTRSLPKASLRCASQNHLTRSRCNSTGCSFSLSFEARRRSFSFFSLSLAKKSSQAHTIRARTLRARRGVSSTFRVCSTSSSYEYGAFSYLPGSHNNHSHEEEELVRHSLRSAEEVCPLLGDVEPVRSPYAHLACTSSVIPFLRIPQECSNLQPIDAANLMLAALLAGCRSVEIAIATYPQAPQAIAILAQMLKDEYPELHTQNDQVVLCAGGIFTRTAASECVHAGASVLMSPICDTNLVRWATDEFGLRVDILPGAATPTEVHNAYAAGACAAKLFPCADPTGNGGWSPKAVVAMKRAMPGVRVVASGGIATPKDAKAFLDAGCDAAVVGAIFDYDAVKHADAARVGEQAKKFVLECL